MVSKVSVRPAQVFDFGGIAAILNRVFGRPGTVMPQGPVKADELSRWMTEDDIWHVAEIEGEIVGAQWIAPRQERGEWEIATFVPRGDHDIQTGSQLWEATHRAARSRAGKRIFAFIHPGNEGAIAYYRSRGFEQGAGMRDGKIVKVFRL
ncbi:GNAT family N-acetyltransferase [Jannaschia aquimarina]|uniref:Acetyltransferase (GNAT) family protein n=1 Tax=Jannaschia aquimarina TaxID=935700 RepID=A0A0D1EEY0_9RHOB|nr:GNAT family N-acetyltransferase [Jannaschia aquimarina]KIT15451.1 Acetyltransferase (GNAT) family protein [Jannaschia aquimarina]SNT22191.1 L-amino acid N-acyltransferase YncA [Jannaschia aquimarina]